MYMSTATETNLAASLRSAVSFNVRGLHVGGASFEFRWPTIAERLRAASVDELYLQEVFTYKMLRQIAKSLPNLKYVVFETGMFGPMGGLVALYRHRPSNYTYYPLTEAYTVYSRMVSFLPFAPKGVLAVQTQTGFRLNLHLSANPTGDWANGGRHVRRIDRQMANLRRTVDAEVFSDAVRGQAPLVVVGDFNLPPSAQSFRWFLAETRLVDVYQRNLRPTFHDWFLPKGRKAQKVDHVLARNVKVQRARYLFVKPESICGNPTYLSDHIGLQVQFSVN